MCNPTCGLPEIISVNPIFGVQRVIVIKIGNNVRRHGHRTLKAWRYERGSAIALQAIEFGNHGVANGATARGIPGMQLIVPVASVYLPFLPPIGSTDFVVDLYDTREVIEDAF
jgi:hypothetical protein